jgi:hypothetical protein
MKIQLGQKKPIVKAKRGFITNGKMDIVRDPTSPMRRKTIKNGE